MRILCPNCQEISLPGDSICRHCGQPFTGSEPTLPMIPQILGTPDATVAMPPHSFLGSPRNPDLKRLVFVECCLFLVLWSLVIAGLLHRIALYVTHPVLILVSLGIALLVSALYLSEKLTGEEPPVALLSMRDLFVFAWVGTFCMGFGQVARLFIPPPPRISESRVVGDSNERKRVEIWVEGRIGDDLLAIVNYDKSGRHVVGVIVRHPGAGNDPLPLTYRTPSGELEVSKYHLRSHGTEIDSLSINSK